MPQVAGPIATQLERLQERYPGASATPLPSGQFLIRVPNVPLPQGWSQSTTEVIFIAPVGYPVAKPDCFWADASLRLAGGGMPQNTAVNKVPNASGTRMWFSWHLQRWDPSKDDLVHYVRVIGQRFEQRS